MADKPESAGDMVRRISEQLAASRGADPIHRIASQALADQMRWKSIVAQIAKASATSAGSLGNLAAERSKLVQQEKSLLDKIDSLFTELSKEKKERAEKEQVANELRSALAEYQKQSEIKYLLGKLDKEAEARIRSDDAFLKNFAPGSSHGAFILSIDIRSSTELMLNAKSAQDFATFITGLCDKLTAIVIDNGGVLDKFTGDGVLAFFPDFYSGADSGYRAVLAATQAIEFFKEHYKDHRHCFRVVMGDTGLGVGIDWGEVHFVNVGESLSVVGTPVVYACRLSSTKPGTICANQPAKEKLSQLYEANTIIEEVTLDIKGAGSVIAYYIWLKGARLNLKSLPWK